METRYLYILRYLLAFSDIVLVNFCFFAALHITGSVRTYFDPTVHRYNIIVSTLLWIIATRIYRLYYNQNIYKLELIYKSTLRSIILHLSLFVVFLFFSNQTGFPKNFIIYFYVTLLLGFLLSRFLGTFLISMLTKSYDLRKSVAVLGMNTGGIRLSEYLANQNGLKFVGFLDQENEGINNNKPAPITSTKQQLQAAAASGIEEVFVSINPERMNDLTELITEGEKNCIRLKFVPDFSAIEPNFKFDRMGNFTVLSARKEPLESIENRFKKRLFDIAVSLFVIIFIYSWLYPLLAIMIKLQSKGPVIFAQLRTGRNNRPFWCYKFRSMQVNGESDLRQAGPCDERVTPIGQFMRRTSLDEFPQFFNVLMGYMSVVGPRPHMLSHTDEYSKIIDKFMVRQFAKPGITGWAQVNGYRGETKEKWMMEKRVEHDLWYMENWSVMLDLKIVFLTIINIFKGEKNAY